MFTQIGAQEVTFAERVRRQATAPGAATAIPISSSQILARLTTPLGGEFIVKVRNGGMVRVVDEETGVTHGFVVKREKDEPNTVVFHQYMIEQHPSGGGEILTSLELSFVASRSAGEPEGFVTPEGYYFELLGVKSQSGVGSPESLFPSFDPSKGICCISCSGGTVCACAISACGSSCCSGACCDEGSGPQENNK